MSKFQPPMLNDDVCRPPTDKQTHKHTHTHIHKHTYRVKTEETFFHGQFFYFLFFFLYLFECKKDGFQYKGQEGSDGSGSRISNEKEAGKSKGQEEHDISVNRGATRCPADRGMQV